MKAVVWHDVGDIRIDEVAELQIEQPTGGIGVDRVIDAVGVDANCAHHGPAEAKAHQQAEIFQREVAQVAPKQNAQNGNWHPGDAPSQALQWGVESLAKAGTLAIIGVYPSSLNHFPIGKAVNKNLTIRMGICNHRKYPPLLIDLVQSKVVKPEEILTNIEPIANAIDAYRLFTSGNPVG